MTKKLLEDLNGNNNGELKKFIEEFKGEPRIAWYPSAGDDFRALFYLHPNFSQQNPASGPEPLPPDLFLFTDYFPWSDTTLIDNKILYSDKRTTVIVEYMEELPRLNLPLHRDLLPLGLFIQSLGGHSIKVGPLTDRAFFFKIRVESKKLGTIFSKVLYAFAQNETFYCNKLFPNNATISHIIHIRYGGGQGGGGSAAGAWLLNVLKILKCELFITDGDHRWQMGDYFALELCPSIPVVSDVKLTPIRFMPAESWSDYGQVVTWYLVS